MERKERKETVVEVFKRLKTKNNRLKGGEKLIMKKILSVLITVTMIFSLVAAFRTPTVEAFPSGGPIVLTQPDFLTPRYKQHLSTANSDPAKDEYWVVNYFSRYNAALPANQLNTPSNMKFDVYKMGEVIYGYVDGLDTTKNWQAILAKYVSGTTYAVVDTLKQVAGINKFSLQTGNVDKDGEYLILIYYGFGYWPGDTINISTSAPDFAPEVVYITYNFKVISYKFDTCSSYYTLTFSLMRGNAQAEITLNTRVWIFYPDGSDAAAYWVPAGATGFYTITFPADSPVDADTEPEVGKFYIYVLDEYDGYNSTAGYNYGEEDTNDMIAYYYLSNTPEVKLNLSYYITMGENKNPPPIYRSQNGQPVLLKLDGTLFPAVVVYTNPVDGTYGANPYSDTAIYLNPSKNVIDSLGRTWWPKYFVNVTNATVTELKQISASFFRFVIDVASPVDVRFKFGYAPYGVPIYSNEIIINTIAKTVFNPYVDITAPDAIAPYGDGTPWILDSVESVYDKLPCTVGNSYEVMVGSWDTTYDAVNGVYVYAGNSNAKPDDWHVYDASWEINGPIELYDEVVNVDEYNSLCQLTLGDKIKILVTSGGSISVNVSMTAWERINKTCPDWYNTPDVDDIYTTSVTEMSQNACCHEYSKPFNICEVESCTYTGVTLEGANVIDSQTVEVGKKVDKLTVSLDDKTAPKDLSCGCPYGAALIYMVDSNGNLVENAFTVDTWGNYTVKGSMIWYNPQYYVDPVDSSRNMFDGPHISDQPIQSYKPTGIYDENQVLLDNGIKVTTGCPITLLGITFNYPTGTACQYSLVVKAFGWERKYDACGYPKFTFPMIAEDLYPITVLPGTTTLSATPTITEGTADPDAMLAGVPAIIDITNPGFSFDKGTAGWGSVNWSYYFNGTKLNEHSYCPTWVEYGLTVTYSKTDAGYRFVLSRPFSSAGTFKIVGTSYYYDCTKKETLAIEIEVKMPEFTVKIGLNDCGTDGIHPTIIDSDGYLTEGIDELIYVTAVDPRGLHDFSTDPSWTLSVSARKDACGLPTSKVCGVVEGPGCAYGLPIRVIGYDNPNLDGKGKFRLYFNAFGAAIKVTDFTLKDPEITVDPKEVPFTTYPDMPTTTHVTFTVKDSHGYPVSGIPIQILGTNGAFGVSANGYSWSATTGTTGCKGEVDWGFNPPFSGRFTISALPSPKITCSKPCGWPGAITSATIEAVYKAPVVDTTKPVVTATAPAKVSVPMVKITGKATDNVGVESVWVGTKKADLAPDGTFEAIVDLVEGENTIKIVAYDGASPKNSGEATVKVTYEVKKVTVVKLTIGQDIMTVNGNAVQLDAAPEIVNGRTFLPLRAIAEIFGATVEWIPDTRGVTVTLGDNTIGLQIGNPTAVINGNVVDIVAPYIKNGRTMVPLRVIAEGLGATVEWDPVYRIVTITM